MVAPFRAGVAQADKQFVGLQSEFVVVMEQDDSLPQAGG